MTLPGSGLFGAIAGRRPEPTIEVAPARHREGRLSRRRTAREAPRARGDIDVNTVSDIDEATVSAATSQANVWQDGRLRLHLQPALPTYPGYEFNSTKTKKTDQRSACSSSIHAKLARAAKLRGG